MKLPRKVLIASHPWKVIRSKGGGGTFVWQDREIDIGTNGIDEEQHEWFLHEVCEAILSENMLRYQLPYTSPDNGSYRFVFTHQEFETQFVKQLAAVIWQMKGK